MKKETLYITILNTSTLIKGAEIIFKLNEINDKMHELELFNDAFQLMIEDVDGEVVIAKHFDYGLSTIHSQIYNNKLWKSIYIIYYNDKQIESL